MVVVLHIAGKSNHYPFRFIRNVSWDHSVFIQHIVQGVYKKAVRGKVNNIFKLIV